MNFLARVTPSKLLAPFVLILSACAAESDDNTNTPPDPGEQQSEQTESETAAATTTHTVSRCMSYTFENSGFERHGTVYNHCIAPVVAKWKIDHHGDNTVTVWGDKLVTTVFWPAKFVSAKCEANCN